jgi:hypothetical protein
MTQTQITPKVSDKFEPGAILENSWGWEQTNIDFFCIIDRKGDWVTVLPMVQERGPEIGFMTNKETPISINWNAKPRRKKLHSFDGKESGFSFGNYTGAGWCRLWDGKETYSTHYA